MEFPQTDSEIRIYCLELSREARDLMDGKPDIKKAQEYYDFICPSPSRKAE